MKENNIDIFVIDEEGKKYMIEIPKSIKFNILKNKIESLLNKSYFNICFYNILFTEENENKIINFEDGDTIYLISNRTNESVTYAKFHLNPNLNEEDMNITKLSGILYLCLLKFIANNIKNLKSIKSNEIREIISELKDKIEFEDNPKEDIKTNLKEKSGSNILSYINYLKQIIKEEDINDLINLFDNKAKNEIKAFWSILSKYEEFNQLFEKEFLDAIEKSYFDYSLIGVSLYQQANLKKYIEELHKCPNCIIKYLFHGTQIDPISKIITEGFKYTRKAFYGMGIYFSDMLDYISFYSGGDNYGNRRDDFGKIVPVNSTFSCVSAEIYYDKELKEEVFDLNKYFVKELKEFPTYEEIKKDYGDKMVEKNGVHFVRVEPQYGRSIESEEKIKFARKNGKFIGTEYVITEMEQILPLYGLTLKRNEYFVIWRDPNFIGENEWTDYLKERKMFMYQYAKMNAYFIGNTEKALNIIKRKKFNKIILISSVGLDYSGKKFVEIARKILGFDVMVLFFSNNFNHLEWIKNFPNALYTNDGTFYKEYVTKYNKNDLIELKKQVEKQYNVN